MKFEKVSYMIKCLGAWEGITDVFVMSMFYGFREEEMKTEKKKKRQRW